MTRRLLPPSDLLALATAALEQLDATGAWSADEDENTRNQNEHEAALSALRFVAHESVVHRDTSVMHLLAGAMAHVADYDSWGEGPPKALADALVALFRGPGGSVELLQWFTDAEHATLRGIAAQSADPQTAAGAAVLSKLSRDVSPEVRKQARERLGADVPWWRGKFSSDPLTRLPQRSVKRLTPVVARVGEILELPQHEMGAAFEELAKLVAKLPDDLALEAGIAAIRAEPHGYRMNLNPLVAHLLSMTGGPDALLTWVGEQGRTHAFYVTQGLAAASAALPARRQLALAEMCVERALVSPTADENRSWYGTPAYQMLQLAASLWPSGHALGAMVDRALALSGPDAVLPPEAPGSLLGPYIQQKTPSRAVAERIADARALGYPGPWHAFADGADGLLERGPASVVRRAALASLDLAPSEDRFTAARVRWAIEQLLSVAYHRRSDGTRLARARFLYTLPVVRAAVRGSSHGMLQLVSPMRELLRSGEADLEQAGGAIDLIGLLWGGTSNPMEHIRESDKPRGCAARPDTQKTYRPFLGPTALRGPPTEDEWATFRRLRAERIADRRDPDAFVAGLEVLPIDWTDDDRAFVDLAITALRANPGHEHLSHGLVAGLIGADAAGIDRLDDVLVVASTRWREWVGDRRTVARKKMSLPARALGAISVPEPTPGSPKREKEWMDIEDDDDA